jgi:hypothetical protein
VAGFFAHINDIPVSTKCAKILDGRKMSTSEEGQSVMYLKLPVTIPHASSSSGTDLLATVSVSAISTNVCLEYKGHNDCSIPYS